MLSYNNGTVRPWRNRQTRTFEGRMGDRVSSSLTGRTNKTSRNACLFFCGQQTCVVCNTTCSAQTHTFHVSGAHLCEQAHSAHYLVVILLASTHWLAVNKDKQKCLSFLLWKKSCLLLMLDIGCCILTVFQNML